MLKKIRAKIAQWQQIRTAERRLKEFVGRLSPEKKIIAKNIGEDLFMASTPGAKAAIIRKKVDTLQGTTAKAQSRIEVIRKEIVGDALADNHARAMSLPLVMSTSTLRGYNSDTYCRTDSSSSSSESSSSSSDSSSCSSSD